MWAACHLELGTAAAVKLIDPEIAKSPEALARFKREAQAAASLRGTNVVQILDYGVDEETPYIVMEKLTGEDLGDRLERLGRLDAREVAQVLTQAGKAVTRAHDAGIVHRDLKPDNIFLARDGDDEVVKVLDFGIAKANAAMDATGAATRTGAMLGTPYYMSPEQASGKRSVDHRTDIWALAVIAFECLTGQRPFEAETIGGLVLAICTEPVPVPSTIAAVPLGFDAWFARGTLRDVEARFQSVKEQMAALRLVCGVDLAPVGSSADTGGGYAAGGSYGLATGSPASVSARSGPDAWQNQSGNTQLLEATASPASVTIGSGKRRTRSLLVPLALGAVVLIGAGVGVTIGVTSSHPELSAANVPSTSANAISSAEASADATKAEREKLAEQPESTAEPRIDIAAEDDAADEGRTPSSDESATAQKPSRPASNETRAKPKPTFAKPPEPKPAKAKPPTPEPVESKPPTPKPVEPKPPTPKTPSVDDRLAF